MIGQEDPEALANSGLVLLNSPPPAWEEPSTFIVSGVARGGTSLLAKLLVMSDIPMGTTDSVVFEDVEIARGLEQRDRGALRASIGRRNATHAAWGFKRPNLFDLMEVEELALFRRPGLLLIFRDPVAIAQRNMISNAARVGDALRSASTDLRRLLDFAQTAPCPVLLVSYEKALAAPERLVDAVLAFVGSTASDALRPELVAAITADNPTYWRHTRLRVIGFLDGVTNGKLRGWCNFVGHNRAVPLELLLNGRVATAFRADLYREDLAKAGIGSGCHAFEIDLTSFGTAGDTHIAVRVADRDFTLMNSGKTYEELGGR